MTPSCSGCKKDNHVPLQGCPSNRLFRVFTSHVVFKRLETSRDASMDSLNVKMTNTNHVPMTHLPRSGRRDIKKQMYSTVFFTCLSASHAYQTRLLTTSVRENPAASRNTRVSENLRPNRPSFRPAATIRKLFIRLPLRLVCKQNQLYRNGFITRVSWTIC